MYTEFDKRMKAYEHLFNVSLDSDKPVIVRVDGRCFHTFAKKFHKPFDEVLSKTIRKTMQYLCENIQECVLGYTQSDEISLLLLNYLNEKSDPFFGYRIQKLCSVISSMATISFYKYFEEVAHEYEEHIENELQRVFQSGSSYKELLSSLPKDYFNYESYIDSRYPTFDCRVFNIPKEEVTNYFYWRQLDAYRNSINMIARIYYSNKELYGKTKSEMIKMIKEKNDDLSNYKPYNIYGSCCIKSLQICTPINSDSNTFTRNKWFIDSNIPLFKKEGRGYIEKLLTDTQTEGGD